MPTPSAIPSPILDKNGKPFILPSGKYLSQFRNVTLAFGGLVKRDGCLIWSDPINYPDIDTTGTDFTVDCFHLNGVHTIQPANLGDITGGSLIVLPKSKGCAAFQVLPLVQVTYWDTGLGGTGCDDSTSESSVDCTARLLVGFDIPRGKLIVCAYLHSVGTVIGDLPDVPSVVIIFFYAEVDICDLVEVWPTITPGNLVTNTDYYYPPDDSIIWDLLPSFPTGDPAIPDLFILPGAHSGGVEISFDCEEIDEPETNTTFCTPCSNFKCMYMWGARTRKDTGAVSGLTGDPTPTYQGAVCVRDPPADDQLDMWLPDPPAGFTPPDPEPDGHEYCYWHYYIVTDKKCADADDGPSCDDDLADIPEGPALMDVPTHCATCDDLGDVMYEVTLSGSTTICQPLSGTLKLDASPDGTWTVPFGTSFLGSGGGVSAQIYSAACSGGGTPTTGDDLRFTINSDGSGQILFTSNELDGTIFQSTSGTATYCCDGALLRHAESSNETTSAPGSDAVATGGVLTIQLVNVPNDCDDGGLP